jgi:hypothetical protein
VTNRLLPILSSTHRPQHRQHYNPPLRNEQQHAEYVQHIMQSDPAFFQRVDDLPYGAWLCDDAEQTQVLFDSHYRPIWKRHGGSVAMRADPAEWFEWHEVYWLYDRSLPPEDSEHLRDTLALVVEEFVEGRSLWVRRWQPEYMGELVATLPARPSATVIPFNREKDDTSI